MERLQKGLEKHKERVPLLAAWDGDREEQECDAKFLGVFDPKSVFPVMTPRLLVFVAGCSGWLASSLTRFKSLEDLKF